MDFGFSEEQDELRHGVRTVLDAECNVDALRAFEVADTLGRAEQAANRWAVLAELGADVSRLEWNHRCVAPFHPLRSGRGANGS